MLYRSIKPLLVDAIQVKKPADVPANGGTLHLNPGDWLIRDGQGNLTRCDDINFKCSYEATENSRELEYFLESKPCGC